VSRVTELIATTLAAAIGGALAALVVGASLVLIVPAAIGVVVVAAILLPRERDRSAMDRPQRGDPLT
jgi:hypothetical protein